MTSTVSGLMLALIAILLVGFLINRSYDRIFQQLVNKNNLDDVPVNSLANIFEDRKQEFTEERAIVEADSELQQALHQDLERNLLQDAAVQANTTHSFAMKSRPYQISIGIALLLSVVIFNYQFFDQAYWQQFDTWRDSEPAIINAVESGQFQPPLVSQPVNKIIDLLRMHVHQHPYDAKAWMLLASILQVIDAPEWSRDAYRRAAQLQPNDAATVMSYIDAERALKKTSANFQQQLVENFIDRFSSQPRAMLWALMTAQSMENLDLGRKSLRALQKIRQDPDSKEVWPPELEVLFEQLQEAIQKRSDEESPQDY
ncbi:MAG: hypothetical protein V4629_02530 [Pseudomonadota bacterium]